MIIQTLQIITAIATILTGLYSMLKPTAITGFTGLQPVGGRGITEIRSILGGLFIALGVAVLVLANREVYQALGIMYLAIAVVRFVSIFVDKSSVQSNWISLAIEIVFGIILVI